MSNLTGLRIHGIVKIAGEYPRGGDPVQGNNWGSHYPAKFVYSSRVSGLHMQDLCGTA